MSMYSMAKYVHAKSANSLTQKLGLGPKIPEPNQQAVLLCRWVIMGEEYPPRNLEFNNRRLLDVLSQLGIQKLRTMSVKPAPYMPQRGQTGLTLAYE